MGHSLWSTQHAHVARTAPLEDTNLNAMMLNLQGSALIPIGIGGRRGEVVRTKMEGCQRPLLISIPAQDETDAVLYAKDRVWDVRALGVEVALYKMVDTCPCGSPNGKTRRPRNKRSSAAPVGDLFHELGEHGQHKQRVR